METTTCADNYSYRLKGYPMSHGKKFFLFTFLMTILFLSLPEEKGNVLADKEKSYGCSDPVKILIDTDMGLDDVRALFALLADPCIDIRGIITVEGSASGGKGLDNLLGLLETAHRTSIPSYLGYVSPDLQSPSWRDTANKLGGFPFPPPHKLSPASDPFRELNNLLIEHEGEVHYLALGPVGNLVQLEMKYPGALGRLHSIWIPVTITSDRGIDCWNLACDMTSTSRVLSEAPRIVLIDLAAAEGIESCKVLSCVKGTVAAAGWIEKLVSNLCPRGDHQMIFDELAAAALIKQDLVKISAESYRTEETGGDSLRIVPVTKGNIRVAKLQDPTAAIDLLQELWRRPFRSQAKHKHESPIPAKTLLKSFHGHLGPYVVLGYRMGRIALEVSGSDGHFDILAEVHSPLKPPKSCLIDGIQLGSGCTLGKGNITVYEYDGPAHVIFKTQLGQSVTIRLRSEIPGLISQLLPIRLTQHGTTSCM